jgi:hypothetical protein
VGSVTLARGFPAPRRPHRAGGRWDADDGLLAVGAGEAGQRVEALPAFAAGARRRHGVVGVGRAVDLCGRAPSARGAVPGPLPLRSMGGDGRWGGGTCDRMSIASRVPFGPNRATWHSPEPPQSESREPGRQRPAPGS